MKVIAAYLLALLGGNSSPSAKDIRAILESVGADAEDARIALLISELEGKDILEVIASGKHQLASVPAGGGGGPAVSAPTGHVPAAAAAAKEQVKVEEPKEESDDDMGFSLFD